MVDLSQKSSATTFSQRTFLARSDTTGYFHQATALASGAPAAILVLGGGLAQRVVAQQKVALNDLLTHHKPEDLVIAPIAALFHTSLEGKTAT